MADPSARTYLAFLVRLWRDGQTCPWRVMVEDPHTGRRHGFADLDALFQFLTDETDAGPSPDEGRAA
jgi:hypothetical protein